MIVEPVRRRTSRASTSTVSAPTTAEEMRQPNESIPNADSPSAMSHLPASGCTICVGWPEMNRSVRFPAAMRLSAPST